MAVAGVALTGLAWVSSVEIRFAKTHGMACELKKHTELLNWIGQVLETRKFSGDQELPLPTRPLVNEPYDCGG